MASIRHSILHHGYSIFWSGRHPSCLCESTISWGIRRVMLVVPVMSSSISILVLCCSCVSFIALIRNVSCIGMEMPIRLFSNIKIHLIRPIFICRQKSAVIGHLSSVSWVSLGLWLWLFLPRHPSVLPPLRHLQMVHAMAYVD
jgi:hypothetical protein